MSHPDDRIESQVEEFLEGRPRASEIAGMRAALAQRAEGLRAALARSREPEERERLRKELDTAERQIEALAREELIAEFVEESVRATASWSLLKPEDQEE